MKKLITTCALLTTVSMVSFAQSKQASTTMSMQAEPSKTTAVKQKPAAVPTKQAPMGKFEQKADKSAKALQQEYKLTQDQYQRIYEVERNFMMQEDELKRGNVPADAGPYVQMNMQRDQMIRTVLTQEQLTKYDVKHKPVQPQPAKN